MKLRFWYARWATPWLTVGICLALAAVGVALTWWQERMGLVVVPLIALLAGASAAFVLDDPAAAVTQVTARGSRWALTNRLTCAALVMLAGLGLIALAPGMLGGLNGWPLVVTAITLTATATAAWLVRRQHHTPGAAVASALVLLGLMPIPGAALVQETWPYPSPVLADDIRDRWLVLGAASGIALAWAGLRPLPAPTGPPGSHRREDHQPARKRAPTK